MKDLVRKFERHIGGGLWSPKVQALVEAILAVEALQRPERRNREQ